MASFLSSVPSPAGKKRGLNDGTSTAGHATADGDPRVLIDSVEYLLGRVRLIDSEIEWTYLLPHDNPTAKKLADAADKHSGLKPDSGPHPLGGSRWILLAAFLEGSTAIYASDPILMKRASTVFHINVEDIVKGIIGFMKELFDKDTGTNRLAWLEELIAYLRVRKTKEGKILMSMREKQQHLSSDHWEQYNMCGMYVPHAMEALRFPFKQWLQDGPAPRGPKERSIAKLKAERKKKK